MSLAPAAFLRLVAPIGACGSLAAQAVLVVAPTAGPGVDHTTLQAAIDASASGGIVLVKPGSYGAAAASFAISGKDLTVIADASGAVNFAAGTTGLVSATQVQQNVHVRGLPDNEGTTLTVSNCAGPVWIEESTLQLPANSTGFGAAALYAIASAQVIVEGCSLRGGELSSFPCTPSLENGALVADASSVYLQDTLLQGRHGTFGNGGLGGCTGGSQGAAGLQLRNNSFVTLSGCTVQGGNSGACIFLSGCQEFPQGPGVQLQQGSTLVRMDSAVASGSALCTGASAPAIDATCFPQGPLGSVIELGSSARSFNAPVAAVVGQTAQLELNGLPGDFGFAGFSNAVMGLPVPALSGYLVLGPPIAVIALGAVDANGRVLKQVALPSSLPPGTGLVTHFQGAVLDAQLQIRLAAPSLLVTLAAGL